MGMKNVVRELKKPLVITCSYCRLDYQGHGEEGEFDSFICDDEEYSLLDDDFEETAVFTQQLQVRWNVL